MDYYNYVKKNLMQYVKDLGAILIEGLFFVSDAINLLFQSFKFVLCKIK